MAERLQQPRSRLEGREPAQVTEHEYDEQGRLIRSITTSEPTWTEEDLAEVMALQEWRDSLCPCCGLPSAKVNGHEKDAPPIRISRVTCWARKTELETRAAWEKGRTSNGQNPLPPGDRAIMWGMTIKE